MTTRTLLLAASAAARRFDPSRLPDELDQPAPPPAPSGDVAKLADVKMNADTSYLSAEEREVVNLLIQAADLMQPIYLRQVSADNARLRAEIEASGDKAQARAVRPDDGPVGRDGRGQAVHRHRASARPAAGFYPADLTQAEFEAYVKAQPGTRPRSSTASTRWSSATATGWSRCRTASNIRNGSSPPPSCSSRPRRRPATPSLKKFLTLRAKAFRTDDYFESELAWMDLKDTPIEIVIGPYETYTDRLFGRKAAFEAYVGLRNPKESAALDVYKSHLARHGGAPSGRGEVQEFQARVRIADQRRSTRSRPAATASTASRRSPSTCPMTRRVREAKGAKKVILQNVLGAKYDRILGPMAPLVLVPEDAANVNQRHMYLETLFHELSHSLGPGSIVVNGTRDHRRATN